MSEYQQLSSKERIKAKYELPLATQKFILQMTMAQWDGQWYLKSKKKYDIEEANELNQRVVFSIGKIETHHILNALGITQGDIKTIPELFKMMNTIMPTT